VNRPSLVQPVGCRRVMSTGVGIALVAAGAILRFAVPAAFIHGLDLQVVSVLVMLVGVIALLLSLPVWGLLSRRRNHSGGYVSAMAPLARQQSVYQDRPPARGPSPPSPGVRAAEGSAEQDYLECSPPSWLGDAATGHAPPSGMDRMLDM
jgi:hypothetical protein